MGRRITAGVLLIVVLFALPARGHTHAELDRWVAEWATKADYSLSIRIIEEFQDMRGRHSWYFNPTPTNRGAPPKARSGWSGSVEQWRPLVVQFFAPKEVETAMCLMWHESKGDPNADNPTSSAAGLFQFLRRTWDSVPLSVSGGTYSSGAVYDPVANVRSAAWLQNEWGWTQWSPYKSGECRQ